MRSWCAWLLMLISLALVEARARIGDPCRMSDGQQGQCIRYNKCQKARADWLNNHKTPRYCRGGSLVCCVDSGGTQSRINSARNEQTSGNERISQKKCKEYSRWQFNPTAGIDGGNIPGTCGMAVDTSIIGGVEAKPLEFPHMVHLGFRRGSEMRWDCGASLISEQYLLTAAHCLYHRENFHLEVAKLGTGDKRSEVKIKIGNRIPHPEYAHPIKYHDIALLQLETPVRRFSDYLRPACLPTGKDVNRREGVASGWGVTESNGDRSEVLMKVNLPFLDISRCSENYRVRSLFLQSGLDENSMICAGEVDVKRDTCQGDSGGPLQIGQKDLCMYHIVGVTSFGGDCGKIPGVYTKVHNYVPWIESIVWPNS